MSHNAFVELSQIYSVNSLGNLRGIRLGDWREDILGDCRGCMQYDWRRDRLGDCRGDVVGDWRRVRLGGGRVDVLCDWRGTRMYECRVRLDDWRGAVLHISFQRTYIKERHY